MKNLSQVAKRAVQGDVVTAPPAEAAGSPRTSRPLFKLLDPERDVAMVALFSRFSVLWRWFGHDWSTDHQRAVARAEWARELRGIPRDVIETCIGHAKRQWLDRAPTPQQFGALCRAEVARRESMTAPRRQAETPEQVRARHAVARARFRQAIADACADQPNSPLMRRLRARMSADDTGGEVGT